MNANLMALISLSLILNFFIPLTFSDAVESSKVETSVIYPVPNNPSSEVSAYYQVVFDERGQALVAGRIELFNSKKEAVNEITVDIPGTSVLFKFALQGSPSCRQECVDYRQACASTKKICDVWNDATGSCDSWRDECQGYTNTCVRYGERCSPNYYNDYDISYKLLDVEKISANTFKLKLEKPVESGGNAALLLYYRVFGYVKQGLTKDFDFQTIKYPVDIDSTRVAIAVDQNLHLKGGETRTDYVQSFGVMEGALSAAPKERAISGSSLGFGGDTKYATGLVKEKRNLNAYETFHVTGSYADATWKLYLWETLGGLIIAIAVIYALIKYGFPSLSNFFNTLLPSQKGKKSQEIDFGRVLVTSLVAATIFAALAVMVILFFAFLGRSMFGSYYYNSGSFAFLAIFAIGVIEAILLFAFMNSRYSAAEGALAVAIFFGLSIIIVPLVIFIFMILAGMFLSFPVTYM